MINSFSVELQGHLFEFRTMNTNRLQLFQVYVQYENKRHRFHMQVDTSGFFHITDKAACPEIFLTLEPEFDRAIKANNKPPADVVTS